MSRTLYPSIRSDAGYKNMQQSGAQVSGADCFTLVALLTPNQDHKPPTIEMSACLLPAPHSSCRLLTRITPKA